MSKPLVSVVIPVHNGEAFLAESLRSILAQDYPIDEIIIVDDGSTDGTAREAEAFKRVRRVYQEKKGAAAARNRGVREAAGEFIAFQDADDLWLPGKLRKQIEYMISRPEILYTAGRAENFYDETSEKDKWMPENEFKVDAVILNTTVARKELFMNENFWFNEDLVVGEDTEWFLRLKAAGIKNYLFPGILARRRLHDKNLTKIHMGERKKLLMDLIRHSIRSRRAKEKDENGC